VVIVIGYDPSDPAAVAGAAAAFTFLYTQPAEKARGDERAAEPEDAR
jgi:hypothetical protein